MTNRTTAELREALVTMLRPMVAGVALAVKTADRTGNDFDLSDIQEEAEDMTEAVLALLPQPPALDGIVEEIDGLFEKATDGPWVKLKGDPLSVDAHQEIFSPKCTGATSIQTLQANASLIVTLVNAWPTLRANLEQEEWRPIADDPPPPSEVGSRILVYFEGAGVHQISDYRDDINGSGPGWHCVPGLDGTPPTHWMPLPGAPIPTPPQSKKEG
jgi:hypothetical protein